MKSFYLIMLIIFPAITGSISYAQNVGVGTTAPDATAQLHVDLGSSSSKGFLVTGIDHAVPTVPNLGAGSRLMFYPGKAAFRAGYVSGNQWDNVNVGLYSSAVGRLTIAKGFASSAMGHATTASGDYSTAMGLNTVASGDLTTAMGVSTTASGRLSTAMGTYVNTNNQQGALIIGDADPNNQGTTFSGIPDQMVARFWNGYYFLTSGDQIRFGVQIGHNGNSWVSICDEKRKENFEALDGEDVLQKLSKINFTSWNYKQQDPKNYRHYGITAQDFYNAFGKDKHGTIGNDTTVNPIDMIGIDMAAIQALEKRTVVLNAQGEKQKTESEKLKAENETLKSTVADLKARLDKIEKLLLK